MGTRAKVRPRPEPRGVFYWLYRALLCLTIAPLLGALVGLLGVFVGMLLGELAALALLVLFFSDIFIRIRHAQAMNTYDEDPWQDDWDSEWDDPG